MKKIHFGKKIIFTIISLSIIWSFAQSPYTNQNSEAVKAKDVLALPDLIISDAKVVSKSANSISISFAIKNIAQASYYYKPADLDFYFSNDDVINFNGLGGYPGKYSFSNMPDKAGFGLAPSATLSYHGVFTVKNNVLNLHYCMLQIHQYATESNYNNNVYRLYLN